MERLQHNKKQNSKSINVGSEYKGSLTDELWLCSCGAFNAAYNTETPILEFIEEKIDLIGREDIWGIHGDWSLVEIDSDLEAELLIYDEMLNNVEKRIVCTACIMNEKKMYNKYYSGMIGEGNEDNPDDEDHYIIELE